MSVQFGKCNFDGKPVERQELDRVRPLLTPYAPDAEGVFLKDNVGIIYRAFHATMESRREKQPEIATSGVVITWDGRLDNRTDLIRELRSNLSSHSTDAAIVTAAYDRWHHNVFPRLAGDWALSVWNRKERSLVLAKDPIGTRHLYYSIDKDLVTWSTILDPLVLLAGKPFPLCEEYVAGWFSFFPAAHLTPYVGIHAVPPSTFVVLGPGKQEVKRYWNFNSCHRIRYRTDREYEEHFLAVFGEAVRRRLRSDSPVLAELSGGMDSSSIVCVADDIFAKGRAEAPRLDTLSYYDEHEPNWNERPYFTKVEERRGKIGCHIDLSSQEYFRRRIDTNHFPATPSSCTNGSNAGREFAEYLAYQKDRTVLSGIGGDEITGGVPTPLTELADLLSMGQFGSFTHQTTLWALDKRKPWLYLLFEVVREFLPHALRPVEKHKRPAIWLNSSFVSRNREALQGYERRLTLLGSLPSFQANVATLDVLRRQLGCVSLSKEPIYEKRYPYLDLDLLQFMFAIPREQLVRPGQRRSLMRRALAGIVPDEILNRKRKAFVSKSPIAAIATEWASLAAMNQGMMSDSLGIIDGRVFVQVLEAAKQGQEVAMVTLLRTMAIEEWLDNLTRWKVLSDPRDKFSSAQPHAFENRIPTYHHVRGLLGRE